MRCTRHILELSLIHICAGGAKIPAEKVIKNGQLVNVMTSEIYPAEIAIYKDMIAAVGDDCLLYTSTVTSYVLSYATMKRCAKSVFPCLGFWRWIPRRSAF